MRGHRPRGGNAPGRSTERPGGGPHRRGRCLQRGTDASARQGRGGARRSGVSGPCRFGRGVEVLAGPLPLGGRALTAGRAEIEHAPPARGLVDPVHEPAGANTVGARYRRLGAGEDRFREASERERSRVAAAFGRDRGPRAGAAGEQRETVLAPWRGEQDLPFRPVDPVDPPNGWALGAGKGGERLDASEGTAGTGQEGERDVLDLRRTV